MRKTSLILICIILNSHAFGQKKFSLPFSSNYNENALISFGIQYNYVYQNFQLTLKNNWQQLYPIDYPSDNINYLGDVKSIRSKAGSGYSVGIPIDFKINTNLQLNLSPSFLFVNNLAIEYQPMDQSIEPLIRKSKHYLSSSKSDNFNAFELPINIKLRSEEKFLRKKLNKYRGYFSTGLRYSRWIGINNEYQNLNNNNQRIDPLIFKKQYLSWEAGIGAEIFFDSFKVSPEIKFNQSFTTVLDHNNNLSTNNKFMRPIEKAFIRNIYFGLIFQ